MLEVVLHPAGMPEGSRWLSAAIPPVTIAVLPASRQGCQMPTRRRGICIGESYQPRAERSATWGQPMPPPPKPLQGVPGDAGAACASIDHSRQKPPSGFRKPRTRVEGREPNFEETFGADYQSLHNKGGRCKTVINRSKRQQPRRTDQPVSPVRDGRLQPATEVAGRRKQDHESPVETAESPESITRPESRTTVIRLQTDSIY